MDVKTCLRRINFKIGTPDDFTGKAVNDIVSNRIKVDELNEQLIDYANTTKGINDVYSFILNSQVNYVPAPSLALRSMGYYFMYIIVNGTIFPQDMRGAADVYNNFRVTPLSGITNWLMPWHAGNTSFFNVFPTNNANTKTTTISSDLAIDATTIPVASTAGFISSNGRLTIGSEKIMYSYKDATNFYGCTRGVEQTTAATHTSGDTVSLNNCVIFYSRLPEPIVVNDDDFVEQSVLDREIEVVEEHMQGIIKAVAYNLLIKLEPTRAQQYKIDTDELYAKYAKDIKRGYYRGRNGSKIRDPYPMSESGVPFGTNLIY